MAHIEKYKSSGVGHMLAHYRRDESSLGRDNIDPVLTPQNYEIGALEIGGVRRADSRERKTAHWSDVQERIEAVEAATGKKVRKDAVVMVDMVVTAPLNLREEDERKFFGACWVYLAQKVGAENMLPGFVHVDEMRTRTNEEGEVVQTGERVRDHMHAAFTPILEGKFNAKKMCDRAFFRNLHKEMGAFVDAQLGYHVDVELSEDRQLDKALSAVPKTQLDQAKQAVKEQTSEAQANLESVTARLQLTRAAAASAQGELATVQANLDDAKSELRRTQDARSIMAAQLQAHRAESKRLEAENEQAAERLESLRLAGVESEVRVKQLEAVVADIRAFEDAGRGGKSAILDSIVARCNGFRAEIDRAIEVVRARIESLLRPPLREVAVPRRSIPAFERSESLSEVANRARESARAYNQDWGRSSPSHGRGR